MNLHQRRLLSRRGLFFVVIGPLVIWLVQLVLTTVLRPPVDATPLVPSIREAKASVNGAFVVGFATDDDLPTALHIIDMTTRRVTTLATEPLSAWYKPAVSNDGRWVAAHSARSLTILLYDTHSGAKRAALPYTYTVDDHTTGVFLFITPDNANVILIQGRQLFNWRISDGSLVWHREGILAITSRSAAISPDGTLLAAVAYTGDSLEVWRLADGLHLAEYPMDAQAASVSFSGDGTTLAIGFQDSGAGVIEIWDVRDATLTRRSRTAIGTWAITSALSPDGRWLVTGSTHGGGGWVNLLPNPPSMTDPFVVWRVTDRGVEFHQRGDASLDFEPFFTPAGVPYTTSPLAPIAVLPRIATLPWLWLGLLSMLVVPLVWKVWR